MATKLHKHKLYFAFAISIFSLCPVRVPALSRHYHLDAVIRVMEWKESRGGTGTYFVEDVICDPAQHEALKQIANHLRQHHILRPKHRFRGSSWGAMGVMQIRPATFWAFRTDGDGDGITDPMNPRDSRATARTYLQHLLKRHNLRTALYYYSGRSWQYADAVLNRL